LTESPEHCRAEHSAEEFAPRTAVPVLARQATAVGGHQVGCLTHERPQATGAIRSVESESDPYVDASFAEVPVHDALQTMVVEEGTERHEIGGETIRRDGGILKTWPRRRTIW
jgi:hypothetical protein